MNKAELIEQLSTQFDGNKAEAARALNAVVETITHTVATGEKVSVTGFGVFEKQNRPSRMVRNPRTGERKRAKATSVPRFRAGTDLKAFVSGEKKVPRAAKAAVKRLQAEREGTAAPAAKKSTAKKSAAKKTTAKKAAAKKTTAKKTAAKKTTAKKAAPAKRTTAKKTATKAASTRKTAAKKAPAKKTTARKAPAKKTAARKTAAKKTTARRTRKA